MFFVNKKPDVDMCMYIEKKNVTQKVFFAYCTKYMTPKYLQKIAHQSTCRKHDTKVLTEDMYFALSGYEFYTKYVYDLKIINY